MSRAAARTTDVAVGPRTPAQNAKIWALVSEMPLARDEAEAAMRRLVRSVAGHEHVSRLTRGQAADVIDGLTRLVGQKPKREPPKGRARVISELQQKVLLKLFTQAGMPTRPQQIAFSKRQCKALWPQSQKDFDAVAHALAAIILRPLVPAEVRARVEALADADVDGWKRNWVADVRRQFNAAEKAGDLARVLSPHKIAKLVEIEEAAANG